MQDKPKFIPAETNYGFGTKKSKRSNAIIFSPEEKVEGQREVAEFKRKAEESKPVLRKGEQLTQDDKDELAILHQQIERAKANVQAVDTDPVIANLTPAERARYDELKKKVKNAYDADYDRGLDNPALSEALVAAQTELDNFLKNRKAGNVGPSAGSEDRELNENLKKKPGFLARLFGRKQK